MSKNAQSEAVKMASPKKKDKYLELYLEYKKGSRKSHTELVLALIKDVAKPIAKRMWPISRDLSFDDLIQESYFGIARAIEKFDQKKGSLKSFAYFWARSLMKKAVDEQSGDVQQKRGTCDDRRRIVRIYSNMCVKDGTADWDDVSKITNISRSRIEKLKKSHISYAYLDAPIQKLDNGGGDLLSNFIAEENAVENDQLREIEQDDLRKKILQVVSSLAINEEKVIRLRFGITTEKAIGVPKTKKGGKKKKKK